MERIGVLPNRWNGPIKREHLSEQRQAWSREKSQTHQEHLSQHDTLKADLEKVSIRHAESIDIEKVLQDKIKALRSQESSISSKQEIKMLQKQIKGEKEKRRALKIEKTGIKNSIQELKDFSLNGSRINRRRPTYSESTPASVTLPLATAANPAPHFDVENLKPVDESDSESLRLEALAPSTSKFTLLQMYLKFNFKVFSYSFLLIGNTMDHREDLASSMNTAPLGYLDKNYVTSILENGRLESTAGFSGAS
jgi:hypothetical protein